MPSPPPLYISAPPRPSLWHRFLRFGWWLLVLSALASAAVAIALIGWLMFSWQVQGRILPGVQVLGISLAGETADSAAELLALEWASKPITLQGPTQTITTTPAQLGLVLDAPATAQSAAAWSQTTDWAALWEFLGSGAHVAPVWGLDAAVTEAYLAQIAPQLAVSPLDAGVRLENGRLVATPSSPGRALDVAATRQWVQANAAEMVQNGRVPLVMAAVQPAISSTEELVAQTNAQLTAELALPLFDPIAGTWESWPLPADQWATWLTVTTAEGGLQWAVAGTAVTSYLQQQVAALGDARYVNEEEAHQSIQQLVLGQLGGGTGTAVPLRIYHRDRQHTVQAGETFSSIARDYGLPYPWLQQANAGVDALFVGQVLNVPSADVFLPLPVVPHKRIVISIPQQRMWAYENGDLVWEWAISTGIATSPTSPGVYQVQTHEPTAYAGNWDLWMPYFMGIYRPVPGNDFMNGFHGFPTRNGSQLLWTNSLGTPVTYGCILVGDGQIELLYNWAEAGVVVEIQ
ncbi:MAG: L,D-transpeptidase family protein [Chloroflexi bacterium]|nr:L,D-transpeptidase family protein [Chloroflexota bacterium]